MNQNNHKQYAIGIDIGGTKMSAVLFDGEKVIADYKLATPKDDIDHFMIMLNALVEPLLERARKDKIRIKGVGLGVPGPVNHKERKISVCNNVPIIAGIKIADQLQAKIGLPVEIDNDARCFVRAEALAGAGQKYSNIYGATIGTGLGGAWWHQGKIYQGAHGGAGEFNKMVVNFETGIGLEEAYHKLTQNNPAVLAEEAYRGDVLAEKIFEEVGRDLGIAFANIVNLIDPEVLIVGGGAAESSELFLPKIKKVMREYIFSPEAKKIKILKGKLGEHAGAIGAALLLAAGEGGA
ncbi:ROK family protein [Patescibacteria group bacterium]|nr:ROK family protein [Patescibacteria group bacterium]MBU4600434.1 ROK family protein [Patescibacteria group bacterium]MCG2698306.1 ROK family protein [Candidatus Parcubacteria bacterium]